MPYFKMNRTMSINSVQGACINFLKDRPSFAPEFMRQEIEDRGGEETDAPDPLEPYDIVLISASNTAPVVCTVDGAVMETIKTGDSAAVTTGDGKTFTGDVLGITLDSFTVEGSDLTAELAPIAGGRATITPSGEEGPYSGGTCGREEASSAREPGAPTSADERETAMHKAFEKMVLEGRSADEIPSVRDTSTAVGFKVTAAERDDAWASFKAGE